MARVFVPYEKNREVYEINKSGLNLAYGDTPPNDTKKIWAKTPEPGTVAIKYVGEQYIEIPASMPAASPKCDNVIAVGNKIYLFGPYGYGQSSGTKSIRYYNIDTGTIHTTGATLSNNISAGHEASLGVYNGKIYIIGGAEKDEANKILHIFDTEKNTIDSVTVSGVAYSCSACAVVGSRLYMLGGQGSNMNTTYDRICYIDLETFEFVVSEVTLETQKSKMGCTVYDGKIYTFGGGYSNGSTNAVRVYDPEIDEITAATGITASLHSCISGRIGDRMYFLWGYSRNNAGTDTQSKRMFYYDLETKQNNVITSLMSYPSAIGNYTGYATANDTIYVFAFEANEAADTILTPKQYKFLAKPSAESGGLVIETTEKSTPVNLIDSELVKADVPAYKFYTGDENGIGQPVEAAVYKDGEWINI